MATEMEEVVTIFKGSTLRASMLSHFSLSLRLFFGYFLFLPPPPPLLGLTLCVRLPCAYSQCHFSVPYTTEIYFDYEYELTSLRILPCPLISPY